MRVVLVTFGLLFFRTVLLGQALMDFSYPMMDNVAAFLMNHYDSALLRKNKVETCLQKNQSFYFDSNGRLIKNIFTEDDGSSRVIVLRYDDRGDLVETESTSPKYPKPIINTYYKTYLEGNLVKDSSSSGYFCKHIEYYADGNPRQELWFGFDSRLNMNHRLQRGVWFGVDSAGRINRIIERNYMGIMDSVGQLVSNRTLLYNDKNQLIEEKEAIKWEEKNQKSLFCPNAGSATFLYDEAGRLIAIQRPQGASQKIKYLPNGLIAEIETKGRNCEGRAYQWLWTYTYTYRN